MKAVFRKAGEQHVQLLIFSATYLTIGNLSRNEFEELVSAECKSNNVATIVGMSSGALDAEAYVVAFDRDGSELEYQSIGKYRGGEPIDGFSLRPIEIDIEGIRIVVCMPSDFAANSFSRQLSSTPEVMLVLKSGRSRVDAALLAMAAAWEAAKRHQALVCVIPGATMSDRPLVRDGEGRTVRSGHVHMPGVETSGRLFIADLPVSRRFESVR